MYTLGNKRMSIKFFPIADKIKTFGSQCLRQPFKEKTKHENKLVYSNKENKGQCVTRKPKESM